MWEKIMFDAVEVSELQSKVIVRVIDDNEDFLKSLGLLLQMTGWKVRTYLSAKDFLAFEDFSAPGCIILDLRMPEMTGLELQRRLVSNNQNNLPIIFLTGHGDVESAVYTLKHGAFDFLQKPINPLVLNKTVEEACRKNLASVPATNLKNNAINKYRTLTPREKEIFLLTAKGRSNKEICEILNIALPTVKMHRANAFDKLDVHSSIEALKMYESLGISGEKDAL